LAVGGGLLVAGVSSYAFFKVGQEALGKEDFKPIVALWFATFVLAPGFFLPLEQEMGRALAHRRALNQGGRPVVARIVPLGAAVAGLVDLLGQHVPCGVVRVPSAAVDRTVAAVVVLLGPAAVVAAVQSEQRGARCG
jgi:hypothetical protein